MDIIGWRRCNIILIYEKIADIDFSRWPFAKSA